jgi:regulator of sirC expression with transglutaminase-like and TPR domain
MVMLDFLLQQLANDPQADIDLAAVALYLAGDEYPDLFVAGYLDRLDDLAEEALSYLNGDLESMVAGLCRFLFEEEGFSGNADAYYDPRNSYFSDVLDRRTGIPITLSVLAIAVGRRAGVEIEGIGLPGHFIAKAVLDDEEVLFDPFHGGQILSTEACEHLIEAVTGQPLEVTPAILAATPPTLIVMRMLNNLRTIYAERDDFTRTARILGRQRQLFPNDVSLRRDLGVTLMRAERPGAAIDHFKAYLDASPYAADIQDVKVLLAQALADVARWN